jgi:hypothetical protein
MAHDDEHSTIVIDPAARGDPGGAIASRPRMRVGVISDTHDCLPNVARIVELLNAARVERIARRRRQAASGVRSGGVRGLPEVWPA